MPRFLSAAAVVVVLAVLAPGCSSGSRHAAGTTTTAAPARSSAPCKLNAAQRHTVALALADIRHLRHIQAPVQTYSQRGAPGQEQATGQFLLDLGTSKLPVTVFSRLLHQAKVATRLCGDCGSSLETEEPVLGDRSGLTSGQSCG